MFVPGLYREPDRSWTADLISRNPLALLVTNGSAADGPYATHVPIIPDPQSPEGGGVGTPGTTLLGHLNRANPHWAALESGGVALATFTGPHAYVSPTVYEKTPVAPTWDFTAVHVRGVITRFVTDDEALDVVKATVRALERNAGGEWDMADSIDYFRRIVSGVGAFRIEVRHVDSMFKLSQEQQPEVRELVRRSFEARPPGRDRDTAELMARLPGISACPVQGPRS
jgi:transcriptional regulator